MRYAASCTARRRGRWRSGCRERRAVVQVTDLRKEFAVRAGGFGRSRGTLTAVNDLSLAIRRGETLGLVGESGCGKTTVGRCLLRLYEPEQGRVFLDADPALAGRVAAMDREARALAASPDENRRARDIRERADALAAGLDLLSMDRAQVKQARRKLQIVFQDPWSSLNPRMLVGDILTEGPREFGVSGAPALGDLTARLLDMVGMPRHAAGRYPHQFSGGQRQRIGIARALALEPELIVADEPVSALDVSIQAQVMNLLRDLQDDLDLTMLFIAHDLSVVEYVSNRVIVMYLGRIMEVAPVAELYRHPQHPYTEALLSAAPVPDPTVERDRIILEGDVPSPINPPSGCVFRTRCPYAAADCAAVVPELRAVGPGHAKACIRDDVL